MTSVEIRQKFLQFFKERGHAIIPSAPLVPENDPTVLFTTAGMHPLVPYLLGEPHPQGKRLANSQKCLRTVDIDEVGDNRHLTFFEMLGNWSLGDYFKKEKIPWSWQFITQELGLDPARLYVSVFAGDTDSPRDDQSIELWQQQFASVGITAELDRPLREGGRIFTLPKDSNWWGPAGESGPCGPDVEMYYDTGSGGNLELADGFPDFEGGRLLEIGNDVFMTYNYTVDGRFEPLAQRNVDTGMGLERLAMVVQGVETVFQTDLFQPIILALQEQLGDLEPRAERILADHLKAASFLISDGVRPSNKERGYILRRLLRRAILHAEAAHTDWLAPVIQTIQQIYATAYPELKVAEIIDVIQEEAEKFQKTLTKGKAEIGKLSELTAKAAFDLYQSYGFPWELTKEYALSRGITLADLDFEAEFRKHQDLSRTASSGVFKSGLADHSELTVKYHTATHLLHQALRQVLGEAVQQRGSNITPERLRFDFSAPERLSEEQLAKVEAQVNAQIEAALPVTVVEMAPAQALKEGAIGLFGHKYGDTVTVYSIGDYSKEICAGPHVQNTGELGRFRIVKEEAVSAGVRRIKAVLE